MNDNELADKLLQQDSSAYMDGSHNWVLDAHPEDPERRGKITTHVPWQAWYLLADAAARLRELSAEVDVLRRLGLHHDVAALEDRFKKLVEVEAENERLRVRLSDSWYADIGERCDRLEAENERLRAVADAVQEFMDDDGSGEDWPAPIDVKYEAVRTALAALGEDDVPICCPRCGSGNPAIRCQQAGFGGTNACQHPWHVAALGEES